MKNVRVMLVAVREKVAETLHVQVAVSVGRVSGMTDVWLALKISEKTSKPSQVIESENILVAVSEQGQPQEEIDQLKVAGEE